MTALKATLCYLLTTWSYSISSTTAFLTVPSAIKQPNAQPLQILSPSITLSPTSTTTTTTRGRLQPPRLLFTLGALPTPEESAQALTNYMAKAHTEKLRAVADAVAKSNARIEELETEVVDLKSQLDSGSSSSSSAPTTNTTPTTSSTTVSTVNNGSGVISVELPFTNKAMGQKLDHYRNFTAKYLVKAQQDKYDAILNEKKKWQDYYKAKMEGKFE